MKNIYKVNEEAVKKITERVYDNGSTVINRNDLEELFPELKESEDERIRQFLIQEVTETSDEIMSYRNMNKKDVLAWLEKQGESDETKAKTFLINKGYPIDANGIFPTYEEMYNIIKEGLEKQGKIADKVEPKFKVGQTIKKEGFNLGFPIVKIENGFYYNDMGDNFPFTDQDNWELVEQKPADWSEDERIKQFLIHEVKETSDKIMSYRNMNKKDVLAWLEKQGEQKPTDKVEPNDYSSIDPHFFEPIDNVKPKFHEGEWLVNIKYGNVVMILEVLEDNYRLDFGGDTIGTLCIELVDNDYRLWTIQDAKDGDVLVCQLPKGYEDGEQIFIFERINSRNYVDNCIEYHCRVYEGVFYENENGHSYMGTTSSPLYPATKEQRDLLFQKIKEAGYEWDDKKKELKEIIDEKQIKKNLQDNSFRRMFEQNTSNEIGNYDHGKVLESLMSTEMKTPEESLGISSEEYNKIVDECIYGEQKPAENKGMNLVEEDMTPFQKKVFCIIDTAIEEEQGLKQVCEELLRLAHDEIMQKPAAWSEEDETVLGNLIYALANDRIGNDRDEYVDWLKSLKERYTWKPSEEQIASITCAVRKMKESACYDSELVSLFNDLKKLKG